MFHENLLIPMFTRSKEPPFTACSQAIQTALCDFQFFIVLHSLLSVMCIKAQVTFHELGDWGGRGGNRCVDMNEVYVHTMTTHKEQLATWWQHREE